MAEVLDVSAILDVARYLGRSYFLRERHHTAFVQELSARLARSELAVFADNAFALAKPDAVCAGKLRPLRDCRRFAGFQTPMPRPTGRRNNGKFGPSTNTIWRSGTGRTRSAAGGSINSSISPGHRLHCCYGVTAATLTKG